MGRPRSVDVDTERERLDLALKALPKVLIGWAINRSSQEQKEAEFTFRQGFTEAKRRRRRLDRIEHKRASRLKRRTVCRVCLERPHNGGRHQSARESDGQLVCNHCHDAIAVSYRCRKGCTRETPITG